MKQLTNVYEQWERSINSVNGSQTTRINANASISRYKIRIASNCNRDEKRNLHQRKGIFFLMSTHKTLTLELHFWLKRQHNSYSYHNVPFKLVDFQNTKIII